MDFYKSVNFGECIVNNDLFAHKMRTIKLLRLERRMAFDLSPKQAWKRFYQINGQTEQTMFSNKFRLQIHKHHVIATTDVCIQYAD